MSEFRFQLLLESMIVSYDPIQKARRYQTFAQDLIERARVDPNGAGLRLIAERYLVLAERELKRPLFTVLDGEAAELDRTAPAPQSRPQLNIVGDLVGPRGCAPARSRARDTRGLAARENGSGSPES